MNRPLDFAESYMKSFFGQASLEIMESLLADDLYFDGPFHKSSTAKEYLDSLREDPPEGANYKLEKAFENGNSACLIYMFSKPGVKTRMAQTFEIADEKICKIILVFDSNAFT
ncbi:nuclear transport factor 2 family protein [Gammaproteobacteria bacterium]|nr:nuclear transport factor 2 family protein [Gammaproteobacteria bacterium]